MKQAQRRPRRVRSCPPVADRRRPRTTPTARSSHEDPPPAPPEPRGDPTPHKLGPVRGNRPWRYTSAGTCRAGAAVRGVGGCNTRRPGTAVPAGAFPAPGGRVAPAGRALVVVRPRTAFGPRPPCRSRHRSRAVRARHRGPSRELSGSRPGNTPRWMARSLWWAPRPTNRTVVTRVAATSSALSGPPVDRSRSQSGWRSAARRSSVSSAARRHGPARTAPGSATAYDGPHLGPGLLVIPAQRARADRVGPPGPGRAPGRTRGAAPAGSPLAVGAVPVLSGTGHGRKRSATGQPPGSSPGSAPGPPEPSRVRPVPPPSECTAAPWTGGGA